MATTLTKPVAQQTVPTSTVPTALTTNGIQPSVGTVASASTDILQSGQQAVPSKQLTVEVPTTEPTLEAPVTQVSVPVTPGVLVVEGNGIETGLGTSEYVTVYPGTVANIGTST